MMRIISSQLIQVHVMTSEVVDIERCMCESQLQAIQAVDLLQRKSAV